MTPVSRDRSSMEWPSALPIGAKELKRLNERQNFEKRYLDTIQAAGFTAPIPPVQMAPFNDLDLYPRDTQVSLKALSIESENLPSLGKPQLKSPELREIPHSILASKAAATQNGKELAIQVKKEETGSLQSMFSRFTEKIKSFFGFKSSISGDLLNGANQIFTTKSDLERLQIALKQMDMAIDKLIIQSSERSKDTETNGRQTEAERMQQKEEILREVKTAIAKTDSQIKNEIVACLREAEKSRNLQVSMGGDDTYLNFHEGKQLQKENIEDSKKLDDYLKTSKFLNWIETGSNVVVGLSFAGGLACMATGAGAATGLALMGGAASLAGGISKGANAFTNWETGKVKSKSERQKARQQVLNDSFHRVNQEVSHSINRTMEIHRALYFMVESHRRTVRTATQNMV